MLNLILKIRNNIKEKPFDYIPMVSKILPPPVLAPLPAVPLSPENIL
jgi:hypothetical protein